MKNAPPGSEPHKIMTCIDGWMIDSENEDRIPAAVAEMMARAMPQPTEIEIIRARMLARQRMMERRHGDE
jgi:hypothetical protein